MPEPRSDMFPDESQTQPEVREDLKTQEPIKAPAADPAPPAAPQPQPQAIKTPPDELYAALKEERAMRKEAEDEIKKLKSAPSDFQYSDEGNALRGQISSLEATLNEVKENQVLDSLYVQFPDIKDRAAEFNEFRKDYPKNKLENVAKIFLAENGLLAQAPRKGLERATGGMRTPVKTGTSAADIDEMMKGDERSFIKKIRSGEINSDDII